MNLCDQIAKVKSPCILNGDERKHFSHLNYLASPAAMIEFLTNSVRVSWAKNWKHSSLQYISFIDQHHLCLVRIQFQVVLVP